MPIQRIRVVDGLLYRIKVFIGIPIVHRTGRRYPTISGSERIVINASGIIENISFVHNPVTAGLVLVRTAVTIWCRPVWPEITAWGVAVVPLVVSVIGGLVIIIDYIIVIDAIVRWHEKIDTIIVQPNIVIGNNVTIGGPNVYARVSVWCDSVP